jgi:hypothetical protein
MRKLESEKLKQDDCHLQALLKLKVLDEGRHVDRVGRKNKK